MPSPEKPPSWLGDSEEVVPLDANGIDAVKSELDIAAVRVEGQERELLAGDAVEPAAGIENVPLSALPTKLRLAPRLLLALVVRVCPSATAYPPRFRIVVKGGRLIAVLQATHVGAPAPQPARPLTPARPRTLLEASSKSARRPVGPPA